MFDNNKDKDKEKKPDKPFWKQPKNYILIGLLVVVIIFLALAKADSVGTVGSLKYNEFFRDLENGYIEEVHYAVGSPFVEVHYKEGMCQEGIIDENTGELRELKIVDNQRIETVLNPNDEEFFKKISELFK